MCHHHDKIDLITSLVTINYTLVVFNLLLSSYSFLCPESIANSYGGNMLHKFIFLASWNDLFVCPSKNCWLTYFWLRGRYSRSLKMLAECICWTRLRIWRRNETIFSTLDSKCLINNQNDILVHSSNLHLNLILLVNQWSPLTKMSNTGSNKLFVW